MACPTCDHTMHCLVPHVFWCPRCGTIRAARNILGDSVQPPILVERTIELCAAACHFCADDEGPEAARLNRAEIAASEACLLPKERRTP